MPNQYVVVEDLLQHYLKDGPSKGNSCPSHYEICGIFKRIFPFIKESNTRQKDELKCKKLHINIARNDIFQNFPVS